MSYCTGARSCGHVHDADTGVCGWCSCPINTLDQKELSQRREADKYIKTIRGVPGIDTMADLIQQLERDYDRDTPIDGVIIYLKKV